MSSHRQCFYCKQSFQSAAFHNHLKQCPMRQKKNNPGPMQSNNPYGGYRPPMMNNGPPSSLWMCPMCSYQNASNVLTCTMCKQGKKPQMGMFNQPQRNMMQRQPQPPPQKHANKEESYWECKSCTFVNVKTSASCKICSNPQPMSNKNAMPPPPKKQVWGAMHPPQPPPKQQNNIPPDIDQPMKDLHKFNNNNNNNNNNMNGNNKNGMPPPPPDHIMAANNNNNNKNKNDNFDQSQWISQGPQEPDDATAALIAQLMAAEQCVLCPDTMAQKNQGMGLPCGHNICAGCAKKYILNGIATMKWKKQPLSCPKPGGCKENMNLPLWLVKECGLGQGMIKKLEQMQNQYMIASDPTITSCPKCGETYSTEQGDVGSVNQMEKGPDGKVLSYAHKMHKAKYRFRCGKGDCKTVFCSGCKADPYHVGYTCEEYKRYKEGKKCRFCETALGPNNTAPKDFTLKEGLDNVCNSAECLEKRRWSCDIKLPCGHNCIGLMGHNCITCMNEACVDKGMPNDEDYCNICWVDPLRAAPCVELACGHFFHFMCLWQKIDRKWPAARITFGFLNCPLCKKEIHHPALDDITKKYYDLKKEIQRDAIDRVKIEGLQNDKRLTDKNSAYYNNLPKYAMDRLAFYPCSKCKKPYFGGMKACEEAGAEQAENFKEDHLVCGSCASGPNAKSCKKHGKKYITYKCKFCCNVSSWFCWGNTHFCDSCHKKQENGDYLNRKPVSALPKCPGKELCPLGVEHPPNGTAEFSLGCVVCLRK